MGGDGTVLYASWLFQRVVPPVASFSLGSLGFLTPFEFASFRRTLAESFDKGVTARLRMRFECTIMRAIENDSSEDSDDRYDILEMHPQSKVDGNSTAGGGVGDNHTLEYWKNERGFRSKADWVKEEEVLNRRHRASESFAVLNELVVVPPPFLSLYTGSRAYLMSLGPRTESISKYVRAVR